MKAIFNWAKAHPVISAVALLGVLLFASGQFSKATDNAKAIADDAVIGIGGIAVIVLMLLL